MLPTQVKLGPFTYRISTKRADWKLAQADPETHWGITDHTNGVIVLNRHMGTQMTKVTLLHELLHAGVFAGGAHDGTKRTEEQWVAAAAPRLLDCLDRSPDVAAFLFGQGHECAV